jgi:glycosyltransferase involved in cell wall biosynthesis
VSTRLGAEGLATQGGDICEIADKPDAFAAATVRLLADRDYASTLARNARHFVETNRNASTMTKRLERVYRSAVVRKRTVATI